MTSEVAGMASKTRVRYIGGSIHLRVVDSTVASRKKLTSARGVPAPESGRGEGNKRRTSIVRLSAFLWPAALDAASLKVMSTRLLDAQPCHSTASSKVVHVSTQKPSHHEPGTSATHTRHPRPGRNHRDPPKSYSYEAHTFALTQDLLPQRRDDAGLLSYLRQTQKKFELFRVRPHMGHSLHPFIQ